MENPVWMTLAAALGFGAAALIWRAASHRLQLSRS